MTTMKTLLLLLLLPPPQGCVPRAMDAWQAAQAALSVPLVHRTRRTRLGALLVAMRVALLLLLAGAATVAAHTEVS